MRDQKSHQLTRVALTPCNPTGGRKWAGTLIQELQVFQCLAGIGTELESETCGLESYSRILDCKRNRSGINKIVCSMHIKLQLVHLADLFGGAYRKFSNKRTGCYDKPLGAAFNM